MIDKKAFEGHIRGPWKPFIKGRTVAVLSDENDEVISWTGFDASAFNLTTQKANCRLIAAAPALLAEHGVLVELVEVQQELINLLDGRSSFDITAAGKFKRDITTLKVRLGLSG